ncbi:MAG: PAS domain S-box protein [Chloroflexota bacterium]
MNKKSTTPSKSDKKTKQSDQSPDSTTSDLQQIIDEMASGFALHEIICDERGKPIDYRFLKMNAAFEKLTGLAAAHIVGKRVLEVLPETELSWIETYGRVALTGQPERFENYAQALNKYFSVVAYSPEKGQFVVLIEDITDRKQTQEALSLSEARYHTLVETAQDLIWQCDTEGRYIYLNPAWEEVFGYTLEEMLGKKFVDFVTPEYAERDTQEFKRLLQGDIIKGLETVHLGKDGREIHLLFNAKQFENADGKPAGTQGTAYDITKRKQVEKELRALSSRNEAILASVPDIIMEVDKNKVYTWANPAGYDFFGEDVIGKDADFYFEGEQEIYDIVAPLFAGSKDVIYVESWQRRKDGAKRLLAWWCRVLNDEHGNVIGALSTARDITDRKLAEQKIAASEAELRALFAAMTDVVIKYDAEGRYLEIAPTRPENLFRPSDDMLGKTVHDILPKEQADYILARIRESLQTGQVVTGEYSLPIDSRQIWFSVNVSPLPDNTVLWMAHDITAHKQAADTLLEAERRFRRTLENVNLIAIELDCSGCVTFCNAYFLQLTGWQRQEIIGKSWFNTCLPHRLREQVEQMLKTSLPSGNIPVHYENEIVTRQGVERLVSWSNTILHDTAGNPIGVSSIGEDITERKQAEEKLNESEQRFRALIEHSHDAVTMLAADGTVLYDSPSIQQVLGYSPTDRIGKKVFEYVIPEERQGMAQGFAKLAQEIGAVAFSEVHFIHKDGSTRIIEGVRTNLLQEPAVGAVVVNYRDITARKQAEEAVETERNFALQIMNSMGQGLTVTDEQGRFEYVNPEYARMTGYDPEELLSKTLKPGN